LGLKAAPCGKDPTWVGRCVADTEYLARQASPDTAERDYPILHDIETAANTKPPTTRK
jgi:hypothetical protein